MNDSDLCLYRLALLRLPGLLYTERMKLYELLTSDMETALERLGKAACKDALLSAALKQAGADVLSLRRNRINVLWYGEDGYPSLLAEIPDPPIALFVRGLLPQDDAPPVAIVGTRHPSSVGVSEARRFGRECAERALPCVSGLALGIDAWAHRGYLEAGGGAVAVLGHGLDAVYPSSNREIARRILDSGGALVSEYLPGIPPWKWNFPARNRIISGLSRVVVIVDAPERSGALITANYALDQGRDVWVSAAVLDAAKDHAAPSESAVRSAGTLRLFNDGARMLSSIDELFEDTCFALPAAVKRTEPVKNLSVTTRSAGKELARALADTLGGGDREPRRGALRPGPRGTDYQY